MNIDVILVDDDADTLRHMADALRETQESRTKASGESVTLSLHPFGPIRTRDSGVEFGETLQKAQSFNPGVAIIDLNLIAYDDYIGAKLALRLKETHPDCCIILVSAYFADAPAVLDGVEVFRFRIDKTQPGFLNLLRERVSDAVRGYASAATLRTVLATKCVPDDRDEAETAGLSVYLSCPVESVEARTNAASRIAAHLETLLRASGVRVHLDRSGAPEPSLLRSLLQSVPVGLGIIILLDDAYMQSVSCLEQLLELRCHPETHSRVCVVQLSDCPLDDLVRLSSYLANWQERERKLRDWLGRVSAVERPPELSEDLRRHRKITGNFRELIDFLANRRRFTFSSEPDAVSILPLLDFIRVSTASRSPAVSVATAAPRFRPSGQGTITWVHLSDLHFCEPRTGWDVKQVLRPLYADLQEMELEHGLKPQFLFFTGDAAFGHIGNGAGESLTEQFDAAHEVLQSVCTAFDHAIPPDRVFLVPGNHDVNRQFALPRQANWLDRQKGVSKVTELIQSGPRKWDEYMHRLAPYRDFLERKGYRHLLGDPNRLIYGTTFKTDGLKIGIAGLNSAWSSCRNNEKSRLWLGGDWQISQLSNQTADADFRIALMHHPLNWFGQYEDPRLQSHFEREFKFLLHGHEHRDWVITGTAGHVRVAAGALYQGSWEENGYNFVQLDLSTGEVSIWLRRFDQHGGGWVPRLIYHRTDINGRLSLGPQRWLLDIVRHHKRGEGRPNQE